jgi:DNA-binding MarR family transcriptional regulator/N-acetylglutamate synthase-like GNAT family acetyltransferase
MEALMVDILDELGPLFLGSRLKRLAERMQADALRVIRAAGLPIQPAQFPILTALDRYGPMTVSDTVGATGFSQPTVTRSVDGLVELGLIQSARSEADQRLKTLTLTEAGQALMRRAKTDVWPQVSAAVTDLCEGVTGGFLDQIGQIERGLARCSLEQRVAQKRERPGGALRILDYDDSLAPAFRDITTTWVEEMFAMEENDRRIVANPRELIIDRGGAILFIESPTLGVIGACALIKVDEGCFELTKMGVSPAARGMKAGETLLAATLERARSMQMDRLYLLTNRKCEAAIHLYEKLGFQHDAEIMRLYGQRYERCNVAMSYPLTA